MSTPHYETTHPEEVLDLADMSAEDINYELQWRKQVQSYMPTSFNRRRITALESAKNKLIFG